MSKGVSQYQKSLSEFRRMTREREEKKFMMRARLAKRDQDYARSPCAAPVTIEQRDLRKSELGQIMRTEWRGRRIIGCNAVSHVRHSS